MVNHAVFILLAPFDQSIKNAVARNATSVVWRFTMTFANLEYDVLPGGATEAVIHVPAVVVVLALLLSGDTPNN